MSNLAFSVRNLTVYLEGRTGMRRILDEVEIDVRTGHAFALVGESGSGKTCLIRCALGIHQGQPGVVGGTAQVLSQPLVDQVERHVNFNPGPPPTIQKDITGWNRAVRKASSGLLGSRVTLIPQDAATSLTPFHTVGQMLEAALVHGNPDMDQVRAEREALEWLHRVEMYDVQELSTRYIHELSGGMAQRVAIALALAPQPELIIADEPTTGLDATLRIQIIALLATMISDHGVTLVLVTHDNAAARILASDVAVLYAGRVVEAGPVELVLGDGEGPKHPYTRFLIESEQRLLEGASMSRGAKVQPPETGCPYAPACPKAAPDCVGARPELRKVGEGHRIACLKEGL
jgi:oligopeptide/dipeptide ABC transporter ATP-binding protein